MTDVKIRIDAIQNNDNNNKVSFIKEDDLELSLSLRPLNGCCTSSYQQPKSNVVETSSVIANGQILTKSDAQAKRRHEAKVKRDLKRQNSATFLKNDVVQEHVGERRRKVPNLGFQGAAPPLLGWNAGGFMPYQGQNSNFGSVNEGKDGAISSGSSSGISDNYHSISGPGGNSSDAGSHSSHPHLQMSPKKRTISQLQPCSAQVDPNPNSSNPSLSKPQWCGSYSSLPDLVSGSSLSSKSLEGATSFNTNNCQQSESRPINDKPLSNKDTNTMSRSSSPKETKGEIGKPPKPVGQTTQQKQMCPRMPSVSTTGNGPNGKTITGILYKYIEGVSIICACHGESFSPAGFVEHAGSVDIENPLKHIKVYM